MRFRRSSWLCALTPAVVVTALGGCRSGSNAPSGARTPASGSIGASATVPASPGTLPVTVAPPTMTSSTVVPTVSSAASLPAALPAGATSTTLPGAPDASNASTWPVVGSVAGDPQSALVAIAVPSSPLLCVGVRIPGLGGRDACQEAGKPWYAVVAGADRLYVLAGRTGAEPLVVTTSLGTQQVASQPVVAGGKTHGVAALAVAPGATLVSVDGGPDVSTCPYGSFIAALRASGFMAEGVEPPIRIDQCLASAAGASVLYSSKASQGAYALFDRAPDGAWEAVNLGGDVCSDVALDDSSLAPEQQQALARSRSVCQALGLA